MVSQCTNERVAAIKSPNIINYIILIFALNSKTSQMSEDNLALSVASSPDPSLDNSLMVDSVLQEAERLLTALSTMCTPDNTDVQIICGERTFGCHSIILKARSMFFFKLLKGGHNAVKIEDIESCVMDDVIKYIYTGQVIMQ